MSLTNQTSTLIARYLAHFRHNYPGILEWYSRVEGELASGRRNMFILWNGSDVEGLAITKNGYEAKLCHISVAPKFRDRGFGQILMRSALRDMVDNGAREVRVTTDEEVFRDHASFFLTAGFEVTDWQVHRYRRGMSELLWKLEVSSELQHLGESALSPYEVGIGTGRAEVPREPMSYLESYPREANLGTLVRAECRRMEALWGKAEDVDDEHWHAIFDALKSFENGVFKQFVNLRLNSLEVSTRCPLSTEILQSNGLLANSLNEVSRSEKLLTQNIRGRLHAMGEDGNTT